MHSNNKFTVPSGFGIVNWMNNDDSDYPWKNIDGTVQTMDIKNLRSISGVLRNTKVIHHQLSDYYKSYESGFIDLLNVHNVYLYCPNLCFFFTWQLCEFRQSLPDAVFRQDIT